MAKKRPSPDRKSARTKGPVRPLARSIGQGPGVRPRPASSSTRTSRRGKGRSIHPADRFLSLAAEALRTTIPRIADLRALAVALLQTARDPSLSSPRGGPRPDPSRVQRALDAARTELIWRRPTRAELARLRDRSAPRIPPALRRFVGVGPPKIAHLGNTPCTARKRRRGSRSSLAEATPVRCSSLHCTSSAASEPLLVSPRRGRKAG